MLLTPERTREQCWMFVWTVDSGYVLLQALVRTLSGVMNKISNIIPNSSDAPASTLSDSASGSVEENWTDEDALEIAFSQVWSVCSSDRTFTDKDKGKNQGTYTWYSAFLWNITSESLRYGTCSQGISFFFSAHPHLQSAVGMSHTWLCLPSYSWYSFTDPGRMEGWVGLGG